ncbi:uncharacterized protein LOC114719992 isoform X1 [Neltuma alba]|uniref:uncharacterized protein LOC114719992 isoform X1 n=2 Tax=Neltuma alba TaxID=207710 RepID=UPI0010A4C69F|nr:uncharacterized protein LOC114719992 isoform X1 [Prosopis alba]XP_028761407.1 uncharacterized protein LOC114719992 isoform X1 [Prosopis alba]
MSSGSERRVSREDIQLVQNLIERCLQLYMNQKEVVKMLLDEAKIEPGFTELVWQKLEEENQEFFKAYYLRLVVMQQITEFNRLLERQMDLMNQLQPTAVGSIPNSNGSHISALHQNPACFAAEHVGTALKPENMQHPVGSSLQSVFNNDGSSLCTSMHNTVEISHPNRIDAPPSLLSAQNSNMGLMQGINGGMIKSEPGYSRSSPYMFGAGNSVLETRPIIGDASVTSYPSVESNCQSMPLLVPDAASSFGFLGQIPRTFSLSDLTADFSQRSEILENYSRSPFLVTDENFLERGEQDNKRLDSVSEGLSYEDFGSD